jgi:hypothetical protein
MNTRPLYWTDTENIKETIATYGVAIIPHVLSEGECDSMLNGMWDYIEKKTESKETPVQRNDPATWKGMNALQPIYSMLYHYGDVGHAPFAWELRQNPAILEVFSTLWDCLPHELLVSFDGMSFLPPPETTDYGWFKNDTWFHSDQSFTRNDLECVQGWVTACNVEEGDGTLAFFEGSHLFHAAFAEAFPPVSDSDWCPLKTHAQEDFFLEKGCRIQNIQCPKGSLVLWDSRTIHCGIKPRQGRPNPNMRAVQYLCYMPRAMASLEGGRWNETMNVLDYKQWAFENQRTTNHYPCNPSVFPNLPEDEEASPLPSMQEIGYCLAGFPIGGEEKRSNLYEGRREA